MSTQVVTSQLLLSFEAISVDMQMCPKKRPKECEKVILFLIRKVILMFLKENHNHLS